MSSLKEADMLEQSADLLAQAQSAVRVAVDALLGRADTDQMRVFRRLSRFTSEQGVFIKRFMRLDDPGDAADHNNLANRIDALHDQWRTSQQTRGNHRQTQRQIRYHLERLGDGRSIGPAHDWRKVVEAVDQAVSSGRKPSDPELRDALLPVLDTMPDVDEPPNKFALVLREIDRYLESRPAADPDANQQAPSPDVSACADCWRGRRCC